MFNYCFYHATKSGVAYLRSPEANITTATALSIIKARSLHKRPTHNQPIQPVKDSIKSARGNNPSALNTIADNSNVEAVHLIYQDKSCLGVALLNILLLFSISSFVNFILVLLFLE